MTDKNRIQDEFYTNLNDAYQEQEAPASAPSQEPHAEDSDFFSAFRHSPTQEEIPEDIPGAPASQPAQRETHHSPTPRPAVPWVSRMRFRGRSGFSLGQLLAWWKLLWRLALVAGAVLLLRFLWVQRFVILDTILEVLISLIPIVLVIAGIVLLIRSIFKK